MPIDLIIPGFDPTALEAVVGPCGLVQEMSTGDLYRLVAALTPSPNIAWIWKDSVAPDVIANPSLAGFFWFNIPEQRHYYYDGISWVPVAQAAQTINGNVIINGTLSINSLFIPTGAAKTIIQVNAAETGWVYTTIIAAIDDKTFPVSKIVPGGNGEFAYSNGTDVVWIPITLAFLLSRIGVGQLPIDRLPTGNEADTLQTVGGNVVWAAQPPSPGLAVGPLTAGKWLTNDGIIPSWQNLPSITAALTNITAGANGQILGTVGGAVTWINADVAFGRVNSGPLDAVPGLTSAYTLEWLHGLASIPKLVNARLVCTTSFGIFTANKSTVPLEFVKSLLTHAGGWVATVPAFYVWWDDTKVYISGNNEIDVGNSLSGIRILQMYAGNYALPIESVLNPLSTRWKFHISASL